MATVLQRAQFLTGGVLTLDQINAVFILVDLFARLRIPYRCTGGLAGNFYGSRWPLSDIDLDLRGSDMPVVAEALGPAVTMSPRRGVDEEFNIQLLRARLYEVEVELIEAEEGFIKLGGVWDPVDVDVTQAEELHWDGRYIRLIP